MRNRCHKAGMPAGIEGGTMELNWYFCRLNSTTVHRYFKL
jgi:hypothetical protein